MGVPLSEGPFFPMWFFLPPDTSRIVPLALASQTGVTALVSAGVGEAFKLDFL